MQILSPLLHERDVYLAWSCKRSRAVCGAGRGARRGRHVVGVMGRAHLLGVTYHLLQARACVRRCQARRSSGNL